MDLLGRIKVRLSAEDRHLVAYGFGGQRVAIPAAEVGAVQVVEAYRTGRRQRTRALLVLDHQHRIMLRAPGQWETYGEVTRVCREAGAPSPAYKPFIPKTSGRARRRPPLYAKAPGYRRLRTVSRGTSVRVIVAGVLGLAIISGAAIAGTFPARALPGWIGSVRVLLEIIGAVLGAAAGLWLCRAVYHLAPDALRWMAASARAQAVAPARRFFGQERGERREHSGNWSRAVTIGLMAPIDPRDQQAVQTPDPPIGGRPLPLDASDPGHTQVPVTVVYLPDNLSVAAARQQLTGSVWHGAPTANLIVGIVFTLALPALIFYLVIRVRRERRARNATVIDDFIGASP